MLTKPRDVKQETSLYPRKGRKRFSPLLLIGVGVTVLAVAVGAIFFATQQQGASHAAANPNANCTVIVPANPLTAQGLATPYQLTATDPAQGPCNEANIGQAAFVQAAILDPAKGTISAYEPLVVDAGTQPAIKPVTPTLPRFAVVGIWFGFNATLLTLQNNARTGGHAGRHHFNLSFKGGSNGNCVNGLNGSVFGQFAYCNAPNFFREANLLIQFHRITVPPLGTTSNGQPCPTVRSFTAVDMDPSDNVQTQYLITANGQVAQFSAANQAALPGATTFGNPSDNALVSKILDPALGCTPWSVPDLANPGATTPTLATDELQAAKFQQAPVALVPGGDEMVLVNGNQSLAKTNLYRVGVDQPPAASLTGTAATSANTTIYCTNTINQQIPFLQNNMTLFSGHPSPDGGATANSLFTFEANRLNATLGAGGLNCTGLLNIQNPVNLTTDANGVVTAATFQNPPLPAGAAAATPTAAATTTTTTAATPTAAATTTTTTAATPTAAATTTPTRHHR